MVLIAFALSLVVWRTLRPRKPLFIQVHGEGELRSHTRSTGDSTFTLSPGASWVVRLVVPSYHEDANLKGQFSVVGGDNSGIETFVLNEEDYVSWQNGYTTYRYYGNENVQQDTIDIPLLADGAGIYYVVFNNRLPTTVAKTVKTNMSIVYRSRWWPGMDE